MAFETSKLEKTFCSVIIKKLGKSRLNSIKNILKFDYGKELIEGLSDPELMNKVLVSQIGDEKLENVSSEVLAKLCTDTITSKDLKVKIIEDENIAQIYRKVVGNQDKTKIWNIASKTPTILLKLIKEAGLPTTTGYRVVNEMLEEKLLIPYGTEKQPNGKHIIKYTTSCTEIRIVNTNGNDQVEIIPRKLRN